jgi:hypothetical protein
MRATWRPLAVWPYEPRPKSSVTFRTTWDGSLAKLEDEVGRVKGDDVVIGIVCDPDQISFSGALKAGGRARVRHPGAEVSFELPGRGRVVFHTDSYGTLHANLHAIALGLEALRAVDRHGITSTSEQYAGFAQIGPGEGDPARGAQLVRAAGGIPQALKAHHPDHGGNARDLADVQAFRKAGS